MRRGFKTWAEKRSAELRSAVQVPIHGHLSAIVLADHLNLTVIGPEDLPEVPPSVLEELLILHPECWSAFTIPLLDGALIVHNTSHTLPRQESNLMHEIAHVLCGHQGASVQCSGKLPWAFRTYNKDQEDEANWLGACLQIPRAGLLWAVNGGMADEAIADHFRASGALVKFRRNTTGVDIQRQRYYARV